MTPIPPVTIRRYDDEAGDEIATFATVETNEGEVDLIVNPYTEDARTFSMPAEQAWRLARELARCATTAEDWDA